MHAWPQPWPVEHGAAAESNHSVAVSLKVAEGFSLDHGGGGRVEDGLDDGMDRIVAAHFFSEVKAGGRLFEGDGAPSRKRRFPRRRIDSQIEIDFPALSQRGYDKTPVPDLPRFPNPKMNRDQAGAENC